MSTLIDTVDSLGHHAATSLLTVARTQVFTCLDPDLRRHLAYMATRGQARRSIARRASALRRYYGWLVRTGRLDHDPTNGLSAPKGEARLPRVLRPDELRTLLRDEPVAPGVDGGDTVDGAVRRRDDALLERVPARPVPAGVPPAKGER